MKKMMTIAIVAVVMWSSQSCSSDEPILSTTINWTMSEFMTDNSDGVFYGIVLYSTSSIKEVVIEAVYTYDIYLNGVKDDLLSPSSIALYEDDFQKKYSVESQDRWTQVLISKKPVINFFATNEERRLIKTTLKGYGLMDGRKVLLAEKEFVFSGP